MSQAPVTRADIEAKLRQIQQRLEAPIEKAKPNLYAAGAAGAVVLLVLAFLFGRRRGKLSSTVVEVRRI